AIGKFFAPRFAGSPIKLLDAKVVFPEDCVSVAGAIACATNCTGSLVVGAHGRTAELPFEARLVDGEWKAMFAAPPAKTFRELLIARKPAKPGESDDGGDVATAGSAAPAKRLAPIRPGKTGVSSDGLEIFFSGVELLPWPADAVPRDGAFLAAFDLVIVNKGDSPAFVADWDFKCAYDSGKRRMRQVWLESFRSIQSQLNPGQKASGTVLFALPTAPGTIGLSGHGLTFEAEFAGRKPGRGK
ncbi:MAG: hypothetical protein IJS46_03270, partial [Kiritimatiellae bacterium]|nr:hypothetical protein [Kiritimatiellia bacterium]